MCEFECRFDDVRVIFSCHPAILDTVDFIHADGRCMFRTCQAEKDRVVFQMVSDYKARQSTF